VAKAKKAPKKSSKSAKKPGAKKPAKPAGKKAAKKPAKQPAKQTTAKQPATKQQKASPEHLAALAMRGDINVLFGLMDGVAESERDALAYKWLSVASDFGHTDADDMMDDLQEASSLRYDDDQLETGNAHWELGLAYLTGTDGLPRDLDKARSQLASARERNYPMSVQESDQMMTKARARLAPDALTVFDGVYAGGGGVDDRGTEDEEADDGYEP
jgi:hypothetical protein